MKRWWTKSVSELLGLISCSVLSSNSTLNWCHGAASFLIASTISTLCRFMASLCLFLSVCNCVCRHVKAGMYACIVCAEFAHSLTRSEAVGFEINTAERGNSLKTDEYELLHRRLTGIHPPHTQAHKHRPSAYLSVFWDTGCRRQAGMTGQDMPITDRAYMWKCVCISVFGRQRGWKKNKQGKLNTKSWF